MYMCIYIYALWYIKHTYMGVFNDNEPSYRTSSQNFITLYDGCNYLSMLWLQLLSVRKRGPRNFSLFGTERITGKNSTYFNLAERT